MKSYINLIFLSVLCLFTACENSLDEDVYSSITQSKYQFTAQDFPAVVSSPYANLRSFIYQSGYWAAQESTTDEIVMPANASGWDDAGRYKMMQNHTWNAEQMHVWKIWDLFYQTIIVCNEAISNIELGIVPAANDQDKKVGIAELKALRAYMYWQVLDNFGEAPLVTEPGNVLPSKASRKDLYTFIETQLNEAIPLLSEVNGGNMYGRINKWAAIGILANLYLNAKVYIGEEHWTDCITQCDKIILSNKYDLAPNYKDCFKATGVESCKEIIFTIPFDHIFGQGNQMYRFSWHSVMKSVYELQSGPFGCGSAMGITQFIDTYDPDDCRLKDSWLMGPQFLPDGSPAMCIYNDRQLNFTKDLPNGAETDEDEGYRMGKYEMVKNNPTNCDTDVPLIRYAQILLMKAECLLRTNKPGAGELVSKVRKRAFKDAPTKIDVSDDQLKENSSYKYGTVVNYQITDLGNTTPIQFGRLLDELGWEFAWEMIRRRDLIRFGVYTTKSWLSHTPQGDYRTVFPIPQKIITANKNIEQNPDYVTNN